MSISPEKQLYPAYYGIEDEFCVNVNGGPIERMIQQPEHRRELSRQSIIRTIGALHGSRHFGEQSKQRRTITESTHTFYPDMSDIIEGTTPVCADIEEAATYSQATARMVVRGLADTAQHYGVQMRTQRRVVQGSAQQRLMQNELRGNGVHDNIDMSHLSVSELNTLRKHAHLFNSLAIARAYITGAGWVDSSGEYHFAQKLVPHRIHGTSTDFGGAAKLKGAANKYRLEFRLSVANFSDWAVRQRLGSVAMLQAVIACGHAEALNNNLGLVDNLSECVLSGHRTQSLDFMTRLAEATLETIPTYGEVPTDIRHIAEEAVAFTDSMRDFIAGKAELSVLARRADWAAKLLLIRKHAHARGGGGTVADAQHIDLQYDNIGFDETGAPLYSPLGSALRERAWFKDGIREDLVAYATMHPASTNHSQILAKTLRTYKPDEVYSIQWDKIILRSGDVLNLF